MRIGLVVNPVAGMGGSVGLKGTDGRLEEARRRGAEAVAGERAERALGALVDDVEVSTAAGAMGADAARRAGREHEVVYPDEPGRLPAETTAAHTREAVEAFVGRGVDLVVFVGGDGTAVDVAAALEALDAGDTPALGVPSGVKMHSAVFAATPEDAGRIASGFEEVEPRDVVDVGLDALETGRAEPVLRGSLLVPVDPRVQGSKSRPGGDVEGAARGVAVDVEPGVTYVLGPGGTLAAVKRALGFEPTPLGVDVWRDGELLARDATEQEVLGVLGERNVALVSPVGGQGFVLGRGNQQMSPEVLRRCELRVVASPEKLAALDALRVDTGDPALDEELRGWTRVRVGRREHVLVEVV